jgi:hypothetical protein
MDFNSDFKFDLSIGNEGEEMFGSLFTDKLVEVKTDFKAHRTNNFFIEYESRSLPSGIATTKADYWCLIAATNEDKDIKNNMGYMIVVDVPRLRAMCRELFLAYGYVLGGDSNTSKGVLVPARRLTRLG